MRTERWSVPDHNQRPALEAAWPRIRAAAAARGFSSAWLLYSKAERLVTLVYYDAHTLPRAPDALDIPALAALEAGPALGDEPLSGRAGAGMVGGSSRRATAVPGPGHMH